MTKSITLIDKAHKLTTAASALQLAEAVDIIDTAQDRHHPQIENNCIAPKNTLTVSVSCRVRGRRKPLQYSFCDEE
jgi:hypothetical protein